MYGCLKSKNPHKRMGLVTKGASLFFTLDSSLLDELNTVNSVFAISSAKKNVELKILRRNFTKLLADDVVEGTDELMRF